MAFKGSAITHGRGCGVVVATGAATEIGRVAAMLRGEASQDPSAAASGKVRSLPRPCSTRDLWHRVYRRTAAGQPPMLMFLTAVTLAVAAIPEALPGGSDHLTCPRCAPADPTQRTGAQPSRSRDAGPGDIHLHRQDRHADAQPDVGRVLLCEGRRHDRLPPDGSGVALVEAAGRWRSAMT